MLLKETAMITSAGLKRRILVLSLLVTSLPAVTAEAQQPARAASGRTPANVSTARPACEPFIRTELFFGTRKPNGTEVSLREWRAFLRRTVTPEFPDGLTVLMGTGQFRNSSGKIVREKSILLILLYPQPTQSASGEKIEKIREAYKRAFGQESVLRVDDPQPVCVSF
jgi:hypothetical protein